MPTGDPSCPVHGMIPCKCVEYGLIRHSADNERPLTADKTMDFELLEWCKKRRQEAQEEKDDAVAILFQCEKDLDSVLDGKPSQRLQRLYWNWRGMQPRNQPKG